MRNLVSIIMNCRNGDKFLKESLNSIIDQTYKNWELVFVDNMSTDNSKEIFHQYDDKRFKYFKTDEVLNLGMARQVALNNCKGEFIAFLDTDDLWTKNKLKKQIPLFEDTKVGMVISNTIFFTSKSEKIFLKSKPPTGYVLKQLLKKNFISLETLICRKTFIEKISFNFDNNYEMISDLDLTIRLSKVCKLEYSPYQLAKWRIHESSETWIKMNKFFSERLLLYKKLSKNSAFNDDNEVKKSLITFKDNTYYSIVLYQIENSVKKDEIINNLKKINTKNLKYYLIFILIIFPFRKIFLKIFRNLNQLSPK